MLVNVTEYIPPNGAREQREAEVDNEYEPIVGALEDRGFFFAYEQLSTGHEVLYLSHDLGDYRILFLKREHKKAAGATNAILSDVTVEDADRWLAAMREEDADEDEAAF